MIKMTGYGKEKMIFYRNKALHINGNPDAVLF